MAPTRAVTVSTRAYYLVQSARSLANPDAQAFVEWLLTQAKHEERFSREWLGSSRIGGAPEDVAAAQVSGDGVNTVALSVARSSLLAAERAR